MASNTDNPFKFGGELAKGHYFVDREEEQEKLKRDLKRGGRVAVSYTHLDVYKRQDGRRLAP